MTACALAPTGQLDFLDDPETSVELDHEASEDEYLVDVVIEPELGYPRFSEIKISNIVAIAYIDGVVDWHLASLLLPAHAVEESYLKMVRRVLKIKKYPVPDLFLSIRTEAVRRGTILNSGIFPNTCNMTLSTTQDNLSVKLSSDSIALTGVRNYEHAHAGIRSVFAALEEVDQKLALSANFPEEFTRLQEDILELARGPVKKYSIEIVKYRKKKQSAVYKIDDLYSVNRVTPDQLEFSPELLPLVKLLTSLTDTKLPYYSPDTYAFVDSLMDIDYRTAIYTGNLAVRSFNVSAVMIDYPLGFKVNLGALAAYLRMKEPDMCVIYDQGFCNLLKINIEYTRPESLTTLPKKGQIPRHYISVTRNGCIKQTSIGLLIESVYYRFREIILRARPIIELREG